MSLLYVRATPDKGAGVYAGQKFYPGAEVLNFGGRVIEASKVPYPLRPEDDHYLQIGPKLYLGPSGDIDDLVNHSCDPNCMVAIGGGKATLLAVKVIPADAEITFDYSTTSTEEKARWSLTCCCGVSRCRGLVSGFHTVPMHIQQEYIEKHMIPSYVLDHFIPFWLGWN